MLKTRDGIICENVCGEHVLAVTRRAALFCKRRALLINDEAYLCWKVLEQGADKAALKRKLSEYYKIQECQVEEDVEAFCRSMIAIGYVVEVEEER